MKQPEDTNTHELPLEVKRGRGRPAKADALDQAERAKRYRAKRKAEGIKSDATENLNPMQSTWRNMVQQLEAENADLQAKLVAKKFALDEFYRIEQENVRLKRLVKLAEDERNAAFKAYGELEKKMRISDASLVIKKDSLAAPDWYAEP